jgi:hypothetical protein
MRKLTDLFSLTAIFGLPILLALTLPMLAAPQPAQAAGEAPGQMVYMAQKCNTCHSVPSAGITRTTKSDKVAGQDLPGDLADKPASFFVQFLKKEVPNDEGNKHKKDWKGTDAELQQLATWLAEIK